MGWLDSIIGVGTGLLGGNIGPVANAAEYGGMLSGASGIGSLVSDNASWLKPVLGAGLDLYGNSQQRNAAQREVQAMRNAETQNYNDQKATYDAYVNYLGQSQAASAANAAARQAAAAANEKARREALTKVMANEKSNFKTTQGFLMPYYQAGKDMLPLRTQTYSAGLQGLNNLFGYLTSPDQMQKWNASKPAFQVNIPTPLNQRGGYG